MATQPMGMPDAAGNDSRVSAEQAGYMELDDAQKDADCETVNVPGGVSSDRGCCNLFDPNQGVQAFNCGNCEHVKEQSAQGDNDADDQAAMAGMGVPAESMSSGPARGGKWQS